MSSSRKIFVFDDFELDEAHFELRRMKQRVSVQPKVLKLLFHLVRYRDRSVGLEELLEVVWPGERVTPASVKRAIGGARRALGDTGDSQSSIRTVRGRGYLFVRGVHECCAPATPLDASPAQGVTGEAHESMPSATDDPFVGRERQLATLEAELLRAISGRGKLLLIAGEPGIGKTRIVREFAQRAAQLGAEVLISRCEGVEGAPAFWAWRQIVRQFMANHGRREARALLDVEVAEIAEAVPELQHWLEPLPAAPSIDSAHARFRLFDAIAAFLKRAAEHTPLLIVFDDLQRADPASLRLLGFLGRQLENSRILALGTHRAQLGEDRRGFSLASALAGHEPGAWLELAGFNPDELARFIELFTGQRAPPSAVSTLHSRTEGNPLFCRQILHVFVSQSEIEGSWSWEKLQANTRELGLSQAIERRLEVLSDRCRGLLRIASVVGRDFSLATLTEANSGACDDVFTTLTEAIVAGVVSAVSESVGRYRFTHALVRDALYEQLSETERCRCHRRIAEALEAQHLDLDDTRIAELAHHFAQAAAVVADDRPMRYALRAADAALRRLAYEEAVVKYDRALALLEGTHSSPEQRLEILLAKGEALARADDNRALRETLLGAAALARRLGSTDGLARAALAFARSPEPGEVDHERVALLEESLAGLPEDAAKRPLLQAILARSLLFSGTPEPRSSIAKSALQGARQSSDLMLRSTVLQVCHQALSLPDYLAERQSISDELLRLSQRLADPELMLHGCFARIQDQLELGEIDSMVCTIDSLRVLAGKVRQPYFRYAARAFDSMVALIEGDLEKCEQSAVAARALGVRVCSATADHVYAVQASGHWRLQGRLLEAERAARDMSVTYPTLGGWNANLATIQALLGRTRQARVELARLMADDMAAIMSDPFLLGALPALADLCGLVGDARQARTIYQAMLPYADRHGKVSLALGTTGPLMRHLGKLARMSGDFELAECHYQQALSMAERMPSPTFVALACLGYADLLVKKGPRHRARAQELLERALDLAAPRGMQAVVAGCKAVSKQLEVELGSRSATNPRPVSTR